ncbi:MAG: LytR C-terminal domain-containing protein [Chlorobi bacterium]|nr:LytR C-terminal domain-containing protein [Chlorobiota bacterium]
MRKTTSSHPRHSSPKNVLLNIVIVVLGVVVFFLLYTVAVELFKPDVNPELGPNEVIQLDVENGCGVKGVASKVAKYLRDRHFDVVNTTNHQTFDIEHTYLIDRIGNLKRARKVADVLGIDHKYIEQIINPDYYISVTLVIGKDYKQLTPFQ